MRKAVDQRVAKCIRIRDKTFERLKRFGQLGEPIDAAINRCIDYAEQGRQYQQQQQQQQNVVKLENQIKSNVGVKSASTGHHTLRTQTPADIHDSTLPDLTTTTTPVTGEGTPYDPR